MRRVLPLLPLTLLAMSLGGCVAQSSPPNALVGSDWRFTEIDGAAPASDKAGLSFGTDSFGGTTGCNRLSGPWRIEEGRLIAGPLMQTKMFCGGVVGDQERDVSALLVSAPEVSLNGDRLTIKSSGHSAGLERLPTQ